MTDPALLSEMKAELDRLHVLYANRISERLWSQPADYVPPPRKPVSWRTRLRWWVSSRRTRLALWIAPWLRGEDDY